MQTNEQLADRDLGKGTTQKERPCPSGDITIDNDSHQGAALSIL